MPKILIVKLEPMLCYFLNMSLHMIPTELLTFVTVVLWLAINLQYPLTI